MYDRLTISWQCKERRLRLGERTLIMGILNVTPDSFSDGGKFTGTEAAVARGLDLFAQGADIVDVGGESTRPGSDPVDQQEEIRRVVPVIEGLRAATDALISVDTMKAAVAKQAVEAGADIMNDVSALTHDEQMAAVAVETGAGLVLMHMLGTPRTMQELPRYDDVVSEVRDFLGERVDALAGAGVAKEAMALDPGIGFGKTVEHNLQLLEGIPVLRELERPVLIGLSRKSFLGKITGRDVDDRLAASLGGMAYAITQGAHILRVHDVKESCDVAQLIDRLLQEDAG